MLDVAIGLALVFAVFAGLVSGVNEMLAQLLGWRGKVLREGIETLLENPATQVRWIREFFSRKGRGPVPRHGSASTAAAGSADLVTKVYSQPLVSTLAQPGTSPSYVPPATFATALVQALSDGGSLSALRQKLDDRTTHLGRLFGPMLDGASGDIEAFKARVEAQFDVVMDRVEGWYKRRTQVVMGCLALVLAIFLNVDALHIMRRLEAHEGLRSQLVEAAANATAMAQTVRASAGPVEEKGASDLAKQTEALQVGVADLRALEVPIGWVLPGTLCTPIKLLPGQSFWRALLGWLIAGFAGMLGAPFWFDAISKLIAIRGTGKKPEEDGRAAEAAGGAPTKPAAAPAVVAGAAPPAAGAALNDFEATRLTGDDLEALQRALGVSEARIDGNLSEELRSLLREWQRIHKRTVTGRFDEATVMEILYPDAG